jgi:hypothetical protein
MENPDQCFRMLMDLRPHKAHARRPHPGATGMIVAAAAVLLVILLCLAYPLREAYAHTPLMACFDNGDGTITCNGGFSDGSSAAGVEVRVVDHNDEVLLEGKMSAGDEFTFKKPVGPFTVVFDAGPSHIIKETSDTIVE